MKTKDKPKKECKTNYLGFMRPLAIVTSLLMFTSCSGLSNYVKPKDNVVNFAMGLENKTGKPKYWDEESSKLKEEPSNELLNGEDNTPSEYFDLNIGIGENNPKDIVYPNKSTLYSPLKEPSNLEKKAQKTIDNVVAEEGNENYNFLNKVAGYSKKFVGHIKKNPWWQNALYGGLLLLPFLLPNSSSDRESPYIPEPQENIKEGPQGK
jgi:hypothetical protein